MINFQFKFGGEQFEREMKENIKRHIENKLRSSGIESVQVQVIKKPDRMSFELSGPEDQIKEAERVLKDWK